MVSRFKSKLCMVLSHSPQPFDQQALTVRLHFESRVLKNTRQHLFNSFKCWLLNIPFDPSPSGQGAHLFRYAIFGSWRRGALGVGWGSYGPLSAADTQPPPSSAVSFFFRDLAFFGDSEDSGFGDTTDGRTDETGLPPFSTNRKSPKFYRQFFFGDF